ncbi:MAG: hypothetical protein ACREP5_04420, partial [Candidatus Binatia bacterium]
MEADVKGKSEGQESNKTLATRPFSGKMPLDTQTEIRMRKSKTGLFLIITLSMISVADAAYIIKLKNGNEYVTNRYWQDGTQVLFDTYGGVFGIDKMFVGKIEKTDQVIKL